MEIIFGLISTTCLGYMVQKLENLERKIDHLEEKVLVIELSIEKRKPRE